LNELSFSGTMALAMTPVVSNLPALAVGAASIKESISQSTIFSQISLALEFSTRMRSFSLVFLGLNRRIPL